MNVLDILKYGNLTLMGPLQEVPKGEWYTPDVCGWWSVKEILAHLVSYELLLGDVFSTFLDGGSTPTFDEMVEQGGKFNDIQVERRKDNTHEEVLDEYITAHTRLMQLAARIPAETLRINGTIPWYGEEYCLDDLVAYNNYGHKREHTAQINVFLDKLKQTG